MKLLKIMIVIIIKLLIYHKSIPIYTYQIKVILSKNNNNLKEVKNALPVLMLTLMIIKSLDNILKANGMFVI